jgi:hypothetical protein
MRALAAALILAAATFATWLAWIAHGVLCEEGCPGRPWPLVAQLLVACAGWPLAAAASYMLVRRDDRRARRLLTIAALAYAAWGVLLVAAVAR